MRIVALTLVLFVTLCACEKEIVEEVGTMVYLDFEGGFYGIVTDHGEKYDPINLPLEFAEDGLRVKFKGKIRDDLMGFHMWGTCIELIYIKRLQ